MSATPVMTTAAQPSALTADRKEVRLQLIWRLADVLSLPDGRTTSNDRAMAGDMMATILATAEPPLRAEVAKRLTVATGLPSGMIRQLALDVAPVARPVIERMAEIPEAILIEAAAVSFDHRLMIAGRDGMTSGIAEAVLAAEESEIVSTVLADETVVLTPARVESLVHRSRHDAGTRRALLTRAELKPSQGFAMFWWSDGPERRRILARFSMDRTVLQDTLQPLFPVVFAEGGVDDPLVKRMLRLIDRRHRPRGANGEEVEMPVVERTLAAALAAPTPEFCHAVGLLAGVSTDTATRVLHDPQGEPFAILAKSANLSRAAFAQALERASVMPGGDGPDLGEDRREVLLATFDTVARDYARAVLQYWDWRPEAGAGLTPTSAPRGPAPGEAEGDAGYLGAV